MPIQFIDKKRRSGYNEEKGIPQAALAQSVGVSNSHMSHIESAQSNASLKTITKIADALAVSVDELLSDTVKKGTLVYQAQLDKILADCSLVEVKAILAVVAVVKESIRTTTTENLQDSKRD